VRRRQVAAYPAGPAPRHASNFPPGTLLFRVEGG